MQFVNTSRNIIQKKRKRNISISILNGNIVLPSKEKKIDNFIEIFNSGVIKNKIRINILIIKNMFILFILDNS